MSTKMANVANGFQNSVDSQSQSDSNHVLLTPSIPSINGEGSHNDPRMRYLQREVRFSTVRRMFCVLALFDCLLTAVLWFLYVNLSNANASKSLRCQVVDYTLSTSLFDFVWISVARTLLLVLIYGVCRSKHWWGVAITTTLSCIFLILKVFTYDFTYQKHSSDECVPGYTEAHPVDFIIAIEFFIIPWVETWVLDFQVLPREKKIQEALERHMSRDTERTPLLGSQQAPRRSSPIQFYSPAGSQASDCGSESDYSESVRSHASEFQSLPNSQRGSSVNLAASIQEQEYLQKAKESLRLLDRILAECEGWKEELKKHNVVVTSIRLEGIKGKVYKLETTVPASPEQLVLALWDNAESTPSWNPTVLESEILHQIDDHTDIIYNVSTGGPGNIVAGRDFVAVRNYWQRGDVHICSSMAVEHPQKPPGSRYVRGFSGPSGWLVEPLVDDSSNSKLIWILNTDLNFKMWTPQTLIDTALCHVLMDICVSLKRHVQDLPLPVTVPQPKPDSPDHVEAASCSSFEDLEEHPLSEESFNST